VVIVKLDIQKGNNNFKLMVSKWVSKYKINDTTLKYLAMIFPLSLQMPKEEDKMVKLIFLRRKKWFFNVDKIEAAQEEERDGKN